jgi:hypothetical protein
MRMVRVLVHAVSTCTTTHLLEAEVFQYLPDLAGGVGLAKGGGNLPSQGQELGILRDFVAFLTVIAVEVEFLDALDRPPSMVGVVEQTTGEDTSETRSLEGGCVGRNGSEDAKGNDDWSSAVRVAMEPQHIPAKEPVDDGEDDVVRERIDAEAAEDARASIANEGRHFLDAHFQAAAGGGFYPTPRRDDDTDASGERLNVLKEATHGTAVAQEFDQFQGELASIGAVEIDAGEGVSLVDGGKPVEASDEVEPSEAD